jgi:predicted AAA+ superfamily ATPase
MYRRRLLEEAVLEFSRSFPVVMITGPRQVGKTTLVQHLGRAGESARAYVSLDTLAARATATEDPELFLDQHPPPVTIDEVQHAPQLLDSIKPRVDRSGAFGGYWLTGSQSFPLMNRVSESLAGRVGILDLGGFSLAEEFGIPAADEPFRPDRAPAQAISGAGSPEELFQRIVRGSFPRLIQPDPPPWEGFYNSYLQTYIERDIRSLLDISNLAAFQRFLRISAARVDQLLNYSDLARDTGIAVSTAREWLLLLEATHQVFLLRPYFENIGKRQVKSPKLYFRDTGLVCFLTGWTSAAAAAAGAMAGALLENFVVSEILKSYQHRGRRAPLWFFRDRDGREVDLLLAEDGKIFPIEVKLKASPNRRDLRGIETLEKLGAPLGRGAVLCLTRERHSLSASVAAVPVSSIQ